MSCITQAEMDALATLANSKLLPIVNYYATKSTYGALYTDWDYANPYYDKFTKGMLQYILFNCETVSPQPNYSFALNAYLNLVPADAVYGSDIGGGRGNYTLTIPHGGNYDFIPASTDYDLGDRLTDNGFDYIYITKCFYLKAGIYVMSGKAGQPVKSVVSQTQAGWLQEFNRIRGDAMALTGLFNISASNPLYLNTDAVCSGPWVVGVNDPVTYPQQIILPDASEVSGILLGSIDQSNSIPLFRQVKFYFSSADSFAGGDTGAILQPTFNTGNPDAGSGGVLIWSFTGIAGRSGVWSCEVFFLFNGSSLPSVSDFTKTVTPDYGWTWSVVTHPAGYSAPYVLVGKLESYALPAGSVSISFNITPASGCAFATVDPFGGIPFHFGYIFSDLIFSSSITFADSNAIHPTSGCRVMKFSDDIPSGSNFNFTLSQSAGSEATGCNSTFRWKISDSSVKGVWVAKTLPVPGNNVFLDQDFPPYVGASASGGNNYLGAAIEVAVAGNGLASEIDAGKNPLATTMRQTAPISISWDPSYHPVYLNDNIQSVSPGITARPAKWLVRRDTDFVPFSLGFYDGELHTVYSGQLARGDGGFSYYSVSVPPNATKVLIRLVKVGDVPGWKAGVFQYGDALAENLTVYVRQAGFPTTTVYDFATTNNTVTIDPDGGGSYLATVLNSGFGFAVMATNGNDVAYDCYVEIQIATPKRVYIPPVGECFSYVINGTPGVFSDYAAYLNENYSSKPIPQNGYCIFKVRATRLPVDNGSGISITPASGTLLTVTVGQNVLQSNNTLVFTPFKNPDSSNLTITIPANARDSGDVKVFIPVLSGNEIIYQCAEQIIFEAWVNWQPIFFNNIYGRGQYPIDANDGVNTPVPTVFQYALNFANDFNQGRMGWPPSFPNPDMGGSVVQFPMFREMYDDLIALLNLL